MTGNLFKNQYLLFRAKNKDPEAFSEIYDLYVERIYRFIFFKVANAEDAQDLTSEVFLKTWQYINDGKEVKNLNAFFYKIARNLVIDYYRKKSLSQTNVSLENENENLEGQIKAAKSETENLETKLAMEGVEKKLRELKDEYREAIILHYVDELSIKEIAEVLDKKKGAVRVLLFRALNTLKDLMDEKEPTKK